MEQANEPSIPTPRSTPSVAGASLLISSGKGGVGKSTVALNLALALSESGYRVGLLDADVYGPDIPRMIGLGRTKWLSHWTLWHFNRPVNIKPLEKHGVEFMSTGFLMGDDQPLDWSSELLEALIQTFHRNVAWSPLDYLVIDLPPGTADLQQRVAQLFHNPAAIIVVTPQDVAHLDARKIVTMFGQLNVPIIGGVENMSGLECPDCDRRIEIFPRVVHDRSIWSMGIEKLADIPIDPAISAAGDAGDPVLTRGNTPQAAAFKQLSGRVAQAVHAR